MAVWENLSDVTVAGFRQKRFKKTRYDQNNFFFCLAHFDDTEIFVFLLLYKPCLCFLSAEITLSKQETNTAVKTLATFAFIQQWMSCFYQIFGWWSGLIS